MKIRDIAGRTASTERHLASDGTRCLLDVPRLEDGSRFAKAKTNGVANRAKLVRWQAVEVRNRVIVLVTVVLSSAHAYVSAYYVDPVKSSWSGWTRTIPGRDAVSQSVTCNFDSLSYIELFAGAKGNGGVYTATVLDGGTPLVWSTGTQSQDESWVRFANWSSQFAFTKSKQYEVRFNRSGSDSIQYYYQSGDPYQYGLLNDPTPEDSMTVARDLAMRVYGRMRAVNSMYWGATSLMPWDSRLQQWIDRIRSSGAKWGTTYQQWQKAESLDGFYSFGGIDAIIRNIDSTGMEPVLVLFGTPKWASTRVQTYWLKDATGTDSTPITDTSVYCAPRNLWPALGDTNYWVRYLSKLLSHRASDNTRPIDLVHTWSIWNESNEGCTLHLPPQGYPGYTGWWRRPNSNYSVSSSVHDMCSLYVRLCSLAAATIRSHEGHENDRIIIGELGRVNFAYDAYRLAPGKEWLRVFYDIALPDARHKPFWSAVSAHPYQTTEALFDPEMCRADAETLRAIMREHGDTAQLWNTEFDYGVRPTVTAQQNANSLSEAYTSMLAQAGLPGGTYDRACWWASWVSDVSGTWGLINPDMSPNPSYYAYKQIAHALPGKRFNGRVMDSDTAVDNHVRMYEFEDMGGRRTWVCWKNGGLGPGTVSTKLPVRTDRLVGESLAYSSRTPKFSPKTSNDGWLRLNLDERPVFITEIADPSRPDLRVDSVQFVQAGKVVRAWVSNHGTRATPVRSGSRVPYPTWAVLRTNGDSPAQIVQTNSIAVDQQTEFIFNLGQTHLPDTALLSVTVNPDQTYVELGTDDNTGYALVAKP